MKEQFAQLKELQAIDSELRTLSAKSAEIPGQIDALRGSAETARSEFEVTKSAITEQRKNYKLAEVELKAAEEKIAGYSVQLYSAKTNEQYKAFLKEIEAQKKLKSSIEDRMISLMEETEQLERRRGASEQEHGRLAVEADRKIAALEGEKSEIDAAILAREEQRAALAARLPDNLLRLYERIRASKSGVAVVTTHKDRCNGCLIPVPAQKLLEIERQDRIHTCEACGRILVPDED